VHVAAGDGGLELGIEAISRACRKAIMARSKVPGCRGIVVRWASGPSTLMAMREMPASLNWSIA